LADLFDEVEEQLRSDRYRTFALKAAPWILGLLVAALIVGLGFWGWQTWREKAAGKASEQYAAGMDAAEHGRIPDAERDFGEAARSPAPAYRSLALMQLGGLKLSANKPAEAVALFDKAAAAAPDDIIGDAARLKSAFAILDTAPYKDVESRLTPLMKDGHPYRVQAREALAFAKLMAGDVAGARGDFVIISGMLDAPAGARARAKAAIGLIDTGSAKAAPAVVRAAAALPPSALSPSAPSSSGPSSSGPSSSGPSSSGPSSSGPSSSGPSPSGPSPSTAPPAASPQPQAPGNQ